MSALKPTRLAFFNEQDVPPLERLAGDASVRAQLRQLGARVTMGLRDLSDARADVVKTLERDGVPVDAWLLLPPEQGYFATYDNAAQVAARVEAVLAWTGRHGLQVRSLGFDFEPALAELQGLFAHPLRALARWARRSRDRARRERALAEYRPLLARVREAGWQVETYQFPLLLEDRAAQSHFFQRLVSALDVGAEREVVMAYSSLLGPFGAGLLEGWSREVRAVAVGSTGGGIDPLPKLSFDAFSRDLRVAARVCRDVSVFSLEGCVEQGWLARLVDFDWAAPVRLPVTQRLGAAGLRTAARAAASWFR